MTPPRSMFRRDRPILFQLPDEILQDRIMTLIPRPDLASLRLTSKLMYTLSTRSLYRILDFKSPAQIVKCCKVLIANPAYAELVRVFDICGPLRADGAIFVAFLHIIKRAIRFLRRLRILDLSSISMGPSGMCLLDGNNEFPHIRKLTISDMRIISTRFLMRHPTLEDIAVSQMLCACTLPATEQFSIKMPNLRTFIGPIKIAPNLVPGSKIYHVGLICGHLLPNDRWFEVINRLSLSRVRILVFECHVWAFQSGMMLALGQYLTDLRVLRLLDRHVWTEPDIMQMRIGLTALRSILPRMHHLQAIDMVLIDRPSNVTFNHDSMHKLVEDFGEACPSLRHVAACGVSWSRETENIWKRITGPTCIQIPMQM